MDPTSQGVRLGGCGIAPGRKLDGDDCSTIGRTGDGDLAAMCLDETPGGRKAEARSTRFVVKNGTKIFSSTSCGMPGPSSTNAI
jgi:hypothetical protein